jgi:hypothetical protein
MWASHCLRSGPRRSRGAADLLQHNVGYTADVTVSASLSHPFHVSAEFNETDVLTHLRVVQWRQQ